MAAVRKTYVTCRFGQLHLRVAQPDDGRSPSGPAVMCFHPSPNSGRLFNTFAAELGNDRVCLAPDTPGFGYSDPPENQPGIQDYARAMGDVIAALQLPVVDVLGYHTGSEISVALALQRPQIIRRLILISAPIFTDSELIEFRRHYGQWSLTEDGSHVAEKWRAHLYWAGPGVSKEIVAEQFSDPMRRPRISWWGHRAAFDYPMAEQLGQVTQPILVLNPQDDLHQHTLRADGVMQRGAHQGIAGVGARILGNPHEGGRIHCPRVSRRSKPMSRVMRYFTDVGDQQIHYYDNGSASDAVPLICFHMSPYSGIVFEPFVAAIAGQCRAIAMDTPGFGNSAIPQSPPAIGDYARTLTAAIESLEIPRVSLLGYHTGSLIAAEMAVQQPDFVDRLILVSAPIWEPQERADNPLTKPRSITEDGSDLAAMWQESVRWSMKGRSLEMIARIFPERLVNPTCIHWGHAAAHRYDLAQSLAALAHPILILNPNDDLCQQTRRAAPYLTHPASRILELPDYGHGFLDVFPSESAAMIWTFLDE